MQQHASGVWRGKSLAFEAKLRAKKGKEKYKTPPCGGGVALDINENCVIDLPDVAMLYNQWLFCNYKDGKKPGWQASPAGEPIFEDCDAAWNF